jgi:hypothetical protein
MQIYAELKQDSEEWHKLRLGKISGSGFYKIVGTKAAREKYLYEKASERVSISKSDSEEYTNFHMRRGIDWEDIARDAYRIKRNFIDVQQVGLIELNDYVVCSPDGLVSEKDQDGVTRDGMIEIKIVDSHIYFKLALEITEKGVDAIPSEHLAQMQYNLYVSNRQWCDYVLYNPKHAMVGTGLFIRRVERDMVYNDTIKAAIDESIKIIDQHVIKYKEIFQ